jgi:hypothetical protein
MYGNVVTTKNEISKEFIMIQRDKITLQDTRQSVWHNSKSDVYKSEFCSTRHTDTQILQGVSKYIRRNVKSPSTCKHAWSILTRELLFTALSYIFSKPPNEYVKTEMRFFLESSNG